MRSAGRAARRVWCRKAVIGRGAERQLACAMVRKAGWRQASPWYGGSGSDSPHVTAGHLGLRPLERLNH
ncbi:unnamed protein product [Lota lota]